VTIWLFLGLFPENAEISFRKKRSFPEIANPVSEKKIKKNIFRPEKYSFAFGE